MSDSASKSQAPRGGASLPAKIGRYDVLGRLGSGRTGTVYRATDPFIGRVLAIKTFRVDLPRGPERDRFLQRFYHEARITGGLSHPNIVALFDIGEVDGLPYLVFEHVEGPTLDVALARAGRLDSTETIRVVEQAAAALDFAHSRGVIHRDIRPANIILATDKRVRIADFGIARVEGSHLTQQGEVLGTPAYMSPEQIRGQELSLSTDLFSLAVCAYEMLAGQRPFLGKSQSELLEALVYSPPAEPKELRTLGIPSREFMFVFERALAKDPLHRFADGVSFARALKSCLGALGADEPLPVTRIAIPEPPPNLEPPAPPSVDAPFIDTAATGVIEGGSLALGLESSADSTLVSVPSTASTEPGLMSLPADLSSEATLLSTVGFDQKLKAEPVTESSDATLVSSSSDPDLPPTQRLSRKAVESLLSKSAPAQAAPQAQSPSPKYGELPPTREMARLPIPVSPPLSSGRNETSASDLTETGHLPSLSKSDDKTIVMTESEKVAASKVRSPDRSASLIAAHPPPPPPPPPQKPSTGPAKPATLKLQPTVAPAASLVPGRAPLSPKIILAGIGAMFVLAAVIGGAVLMNKRPAPDTVEMWNDLPVIKEADVDKSPVVTLQDATQPKVQTTVSVTLTWIVTPDGLVDELKVVISASPEIDAFVMARILKWRYEAGMKAGKTVPVRVIRKYTYEPRGGS